MGGAWVFPGGAVDAGDGGPLAASALDAPGDDSAAWRAAALRELVEETGVWLTTEGASTKLPRDAVDAEVYERIVESGTRLAAGSLAYFARWITPSMLPIRFDTRFYAAVVDDDVTPDPDGDELDRAEWVRPIDALDNARSGRWAIPFPTRKTLEFLAGFDSPTALVAYADEAMVEPVEPRLRYDEATGDVSIVLPHEHGFDQLPAIPDHAEEMLARFREAGDGAVAKAEGVAPFVTSLLAANPGPFTGPGTNTYVVASAGSAVIIDPGPLLDDHLAAIRAAVSAFTVTGILVTHTHADHAPAANPLGIEFGAPVYGFGPGPQFDPTHQLADGDRVTVGAIEIEAVHTPGHTPDHLCFRIGDLLFTGDHIMGGSTVILDDAAAYMASLRKVADLGVRRLYPGHGPELPDAGVAVAEYIAHREMREEQILASLADGATTVDELVAEIYADVPGELVGAATRQVEVQLRKLAADGRVSLPAGAGGTGSRITLLEGSGS